MPPHAMAGPGPPLHLLSAMLSWPMAVGLVAVGLVTVGPVAISLVAVRLVAVGLVAMVPVATRVAVGVRRQGGRQASCCCCCVGRRRGSCPRGSAAPPGSPRACSSVREGRHLWGA